MPFKNVFILCTGRSGSKTFVEACKQITNYTSGHETKTQALGAERFNFPIHHIEGDNRLTWFLGLMSEKFKPEETFYVHLIRDKSLTTQSYNRRWHKPHNIMSAFSGGILKTPKVKLSATQRLQVCEDYYDTVNANVTLFLKSQPNQMVIKIDQVQAQFPLFWEAIGAEGDKDAAIEELGIRHNPSDPKRLTTLLYHIKLNLFRLKFWS